MHPTRYCLLPIPSHFSVGAACGAAGVDGLVPTRRSVGASAVWRVGERAAVYFDRGVVFLEGAAGAAGAAWTPVSVEELIEAARRAGGAPAGAAARR